MINDQNLTSALKNLASQTRRIIEESISHGKVLPDEELLLKWKIDKFQYTDLGVTERGAHGDYVTRKSWIRAYSHIGELVKKSEEYAFTLEILTQIGKNRTDNYLERFVTKLVSTYLNEPNIYEKDVDVLIRIYLKDLKGEPLKYGAEAELDGIVLKPERIEFQIGDMSIVLRQTQIADLEKEYPLYGFSTQQRLDTPSAILQIEFLGRQANEIQVKIEQAVAILRLFKVGSVEHISYRMYSESITDIMAFGRIGSITPPKSLEKSLIIEEDKQKLKLFWETMARSMPSSFYDFRETRIDYIDIAFERYCDALLQNGVVERRIANAVMGLESLFLKGSEAQELSYRLRMRIAKIFSLVGFDSYKIRDIIQDAYKVRSSFVHGAHLTYKGKRELNTKYGDIRAFIQFLLNYLRISIIIIILIKKEKEELLDLIDDALVDTVKNSQLNNLLNMPRNLIS